MKQFIQKLIISILGVLFLAGFNKLFSSPTLWHYLSLLLFLFLLYYLLFPLARKIWSQIFRRYKTFFPKIGILNGNIYSPLREHKCERAWTNVTPSMWEHALRQKITRRIDLITTTQISNSYSIIINPLGDVFPEQDVKLHSTFYSICEFIKDGGIFVVTGGAFFSHQNTIHSVQPQWVFTKTTNGVQSLKESFLFLEFGVETTGDEYLGGKMVSKEPVEIEIYQKENDKKYTGNVILPSKVNRFRAATSNTADYIPFIREKDDKSYPVIAVRYGLGYLIHAGLFLEAESSKEFALLIAIIESLIKSRFRSL